MGHGAQAGAPIQSPILADDGVGSPRLRIRNLWTISTPKNCSNPLFQGFALPVRNCTLTPLSSFTVCLSETATRFEPSADFSRLMPSMSLGVMSSFGACVMESISFLAGPCCFPILERWALWEWDSAAPAAEKRSGIGAGRGRRAHGFNLQTRRRIQRHQH